MEDQDLKTATNSNLLTEDKIGSSIDDVKDFVTRTSLFIMAFPRPRICRTRLTTLMLVIITGALLISLFNYGISSLRSDDEDLPQDILDPRYISRQKALKRKLIEKFHLEEGKGPSQMCKVPHLSLETDVNKFAFGQMPPLDCGGNNLFILDNYEVRIDETVLQKKNLTKCIYKSIDWDTDTNFKFSTPVEKKYPGPFEMIIKNEFFHVECYLDGKGNQISDGHSIQGYEMFGGSPMQQRRKLLQNENPVDGRKSHLASDDQINKIVEGQNLNGRYVKDIVKNIQDALHQPRGHSGSVAGKDNPGDGGPEKEKVPSSIRQRNGRWMEGPGSMGLPDSPLIHQGRRKTGIQPSDQLGTDKSEKTKQLHQDQQQDSPKNQSLRNKAAGGSVQENKDSVQVYGNDDVPSRYRSVGLQSENKKGQKVNLAKQSPVLENNKGLSDTENKQESLQEEEKVLHKVTSPPKSNDKASDGAEVPVKDQNGEDENNPGVYMTEDPYLDYPFTYMDMPDYEQFFAQIVPKPELINRARKMKVQPDSHRKMNVLIFTMDSMSHLTYQRKMPRTYEYIQKEMGAVVLNGYNIVGDATTAAIIPLMTGRTEMELPEVRKNQPGSTYVDSYPLIWNKFEQQGYVTLFTEDKPDIAVFNLRLNGFEDIPVDHYMRPFYLAWLASNLKENSASYCTGGTPSHLYMLNYLKDFFIKYPADIPKFAFGFLNDLSHDDNDPAQYLDKDLVAFFKWMKKAGHLDNTVVVIMGDHGARYSRVRKTTQGKLEERLPMMSLAFPKWFQKKYPEAMAQLEVNSDRLTSPFDVHETLKSILDPRSLSKPVTYSQRGVSLLRPHPLNRTCQSAGIDMHWCTCMNWQEVDPTNDRVLKAAQILVEYINGIIGADSDICSPLKLGKISDAKLGLPNEKVLKYLKSSDGDNRVANFTNELKSDVFYMQVILETLPGRGLFEATVIISEGGSVYKVAPDISRINMYGDQAHCVASDMPDLRKYCYCKKPKPTSKPKIPRSQKHNVNKGAQKWR